jgi:hypothetical protein
MTSTTTAHTDATGNRTLAARARELAASSPRGSVARKAAGCCAVALAETRTTAAARAVLDGYKGDPDVLAVARCLLGQLATATTPPGKE